ncbi:IS1 family transposase [Xenorhabdus stockiae]|uniref:IS1 family transposase n=1 Tax=Xenorhabdus stockiae TaxID=351614 RepID=UPI0040648CAF
MEKTQIAKIDVICPSCCAVKGIHRNGRSRSGHQQKINNDLYNDKDIIIKT